MTEEQLILTQEGYNKLEQERDELVSVKRKEVSERLKEAISYGDLSENAEYDAAKNEQAEMEVRIQQLENMMRNAKIISEDEVTGEFVNVGLKVTAKNIEEGIEEGFIIVGSTESDPFAEPPKISNESAVGRALLGNKVGDTVEVMIPDGIVHYQIEAISKEF